MRNVHIRFKRGGTQLYHDFIMTAFDMSTSDLRGVTHNSSVTATQLRSGSPRQIKRGKTRLPDDFNATERLISGLFKGGGSATVGEALMSAQASLLDETATSHPYYWAGFAIVGDGAQRLLSAR